MISKWKVLSEKNLTPSKWFPLVQHEVELPNGTIIDDFFIAPFGNAVMILPFTKKNEVVLVKQYKHGIGEILLELPAGMQQENKSVEESARAELMEETGMLAGEGQLRSIGKISNNPTKTNHVTYGFIGTGLEINSQQKFDVTEDIELVYVSPRELLKMVMDERVWTGDSAAFILKAYYLFPELFK